MDPQEYARLLRNAGEARRKGISSAAIDGYLLQKIGLNHKALVAAVKAMPQEEVYPTADKEITTQALLRAQAYGTLGPLAPVLEALVRSKADSGKWRDIRDNINAERKAFEKDHPALARSYTAIGALTPVGGAVRGTQAALRGAATGVSRLPRVGNALARIFTSPVTRGVAPGMAGGAVAGELMADDPMTGAALGGLAGAASIPAGALLQRAPAAADMTKTALKRILPLIGAGGAGAGLMQFLTGD